VTKRNSKLVYSTEHGRIKAPDKGAKEILANDGVVRIPREIKGRGGKAVCVISGIASHELKPICKLLKARCGSGGAVKNQCIEIQGDHREVIKSMLEARGLTVKRAGG
jgi:translation initiation factor 1